MRQCYLFVLPILAWMLIAGQAQASEEISVETLVVQARVHRLVHHIEFGFGSLWAIHPRSPTLVRINAATNEATDTRIYEIGTPGVLAVDDTGLWISDLKKKAIFKINPTDYSVVAQIPVPLLSTEGIIAVGQGAVWAVTAEDFDRTLTRFNSQSGRIEARILLPSSASGVISAYGSIWVTGFSKELYGIDPQRNAVTSIIKLHDIPGDLAAGEGSIWVLNQSASVQRIDSRTGKLLVTIETGLPFGPAGITTGGGYTWISMQGVPVTQIDPRADTVLHKFVGGHGIGGPIRYGAGSLWIAGGRISRLQPPK